MTKVQGTADPQARKPYQRPAVVYEARLEAQAGSPIDGIPDILDLTQTSN